MIQAITHTTVVSSFVTFGVVLIICPLRLIKGSTTTDRVATFGTTSTAVMSIMGVSGVLMGTVSFLDSIMLAAIISLASSISILRFVGGGHASNGNNKRSL